MKIDINSWHFKLWDKFFGRRSSSPPSLCKYFWQVVSSIVLSMLLAIITIMVGSIAMLFGARPSFRFINDWDSYKGWHPFKSNPDFVVYPGTLVFPLLVEPTYRLFVSFHKSAPDSLSTNLATLLFASVLLTASLVVCYIVVAGIITPLKLKSINKRHDSTDRQPNLLSSYLTAKKQKFCPTIEFVDFQKENTNV